MTFQYTANLQTVDHQTVLLLRLSPIFARIRYEIVPCGGAVCSAALAAGAGAAGGKWGAPGVAADGGARHCYVEIPQFAITFLTRPFTTLAPPYRLHQHCHRSEQARRPLERPRLR